MHLKSNHRNIFVKKLNKDSSFRIESELGVAGIRGTQFGLSTDSDSTELAVLEGKVAFKDANEKIKIVETSEQIIGTQRGANEVNIIPDAKKNELANSVTEINKVAANYDMKRLANIVDGYASKPNYTVKSALNMELVWCPPGGFIMGDKNDGPAHPVVLTKGFYLGKFEVTQEQYEKVMGNNPSSFKGNKLPVEQVTWFNTVAFCESLNRKERIPSDWKFSLPTEAQWEYACRAGTTTYFSWGNSPDPKLANYKDSGINKTKEVGSYRPNPWGFYDMHGNVMEWCNDWFGNFSNELVIDPTGPSKGDRRILKGAAWSYDGMLCRSANRMNFKANGGYRSDKRGFRLCLITAR